MKIYFEVEECRNTELLEKMGQIKSYEEFAELAEEYGWNECVDAFAAANEWFDIDWIKDRLIEAFYGEDSPCESILFDAVNDALERAV